MNKLINKSITAVLLLLCTQGILCAQEAVAPATDSCFSLHLNMTDYILLFIVIILLIPIFYLSKIVNWSLKYYLEKLIQSKNTHSVIIFFLVGLPLYTLAQDAAPAASESAVSNINYLRWFLFGIIVCEVIVLAIFSALIFKQFDQYETSAKSVEEKSTENALVRWWNKMNNFGKIEDEAKIDLGHSYDGIRELDNNIPAWFTGIFLATLIFGIVYMWQYHIAKVSPLMEEEYRIEEEQADLEYQAYLKTSGSGIDENTLAFGDDKAAIEDGKKLFIANCASCHVNDGGGAAGPNLVDNSWIYGCNAKDVYQSIKYGRKNGMMAWKDNFNDKQILALTNFVHSLSGTKPASPKAAQGEVCSVTIASDSTATVDTKADSTALASSK